MPFQNIKM